MSALAAQRRAAERRSALLEPELVHHRRELAVVGGDQAPELVGGQEGRQEADLLRQPPGTPATRRLPDRLLELLDHCRRGCPWARRCHATDRARPDSRPRSPSACPGRSDRAWSPSAASTRKCPALDVRDQGRRQLDDALDPAAEEVDGRLPLAERHVDHLWRPRPGKEPTRTSACGCRYRSCRSGTCRGSSWRPRPSP